MVEPIEVETGADGHRESVKAVLQELFGEFFGLSPGEVPTDVSFLALGADSLLLLQASNALQERLGVRIAFRRLLEELATVDSLAAHLAPLSPPVRPDPRPAPPLPPALSPPCAPQMPPIPLAVVEEALRAGQQPPAPVPAAAVCGDAPAPVGRDLPSIVAEQLRLMRQQLELLNRGRPAAAPSVSASVFALGPEPPPQPAPAPAAAASRPVYVPHRAIDRSTGQVLSPRQREHLDRLIARLAGRTRRSKEIAQAWREVLANNRAVSGFRLLWKELVYPLVGHRGAGARIWDVDGNEYVDLTMGFGSLLFGHSPEFLKQALHEQVELGIQVGPESETAGEVARLVRELTGAERVTFCNSGTEAVMTALRLARTVTGRPRIALFTGSFHGTFDGVLALGQRGADGRLRPAPMAPGIPRHMIDELLVLDYESADSLAIVEAHAQELAAVLVEPRQSRRPDLETREFLRRLREITSRTGVALVFDEVVTGFRMHPGGIQALYEVRADLTTYGKAVGNGMPIGIVAGKAAYMDAIDGGFWRYGDRSLPEAEITFFGGTFFRHPLVMASALAVLREIQARPGLQEELGRRTARLVSSLNGLFAAEGLPVHVVHYGSLFTFVFPPEWTWADLFFYHLLDRGVYVWERRVCYLSTAHTEEDMERVERAVRESLRELRQGGFLPDAPREAGPLRLPLTAAQRELWALAQLGDEASVAYNLSVSLHLQGPLVTDALGRAAQAVVERHPALRLTLDPLGEWQEVAPHLVLELPLEDISRDGEDKLAVRLTAEARHLFDLTRGPLLRLRLFRLGQEHHTLSVTVHHLVADGHSLATVLREIARLYRAEIAGEAAPLATPADYESYVRSLVARQEGAEGTALEAFWLDRFASPVPVLALPTDHPRPTVQSYRGDCQVTPLGPDLAGALRSAAGQLGSTFFMLLGAAIFALLHRLTGQDDLVVGTPTAEPLQLGGAPLVGYCLSVLPLRLEVSPEAGFATLVGGVRDAVVAAWEHQGYPLSHLIRRLGLAPDPSRPPLVAATFNLDRVSGLDFPGLAVALAGNPTRAAQFEIEWNAVEAGPELLLECPWSTDLFDASTVERWQRHLCHLLAEAAADPRCPVGDLVLFHAAEREQLLVEWNRTASPLPPDHSFYEIFAASARRAPDAVAAACGGEQVSYGDLFQRAECLARALADSGVGPDSVVALLAERDLGFVTCILGIFAAGGAYLPLDPRHPVRKQRQVVGESGVRWLVASPRLLAQASEVVAGLAPEGRSRVLPLGGPALPIPDGAGAPESAAVSAPLLRSLPGNLAYVIFTSGSTGQPKGVMIEHRSLLNHLYAMIAELGLGPDDRIAQTASQCFDISVWQLLTPLLLAGRIEIYGDDLAYAPLDLLGRVEADGIAVVEIVPSLLETLLRELERSGAPRPGLASLRWVLPTGEALPADLCRRWLELYPRITLVNAYGPAECSDDVSLHCLRQAPASGARVPIGRPIANTRLYGADRRLRPVPIGVWGELAVGGIAVGRGYLGDPWRTAEVFCPDPFSAEPGLRLYRTGDLARRLPGGEIEFLGRTDHQVKIRGFRVELGEVESTLEQHPGVGQAVVLVRQDRPGEKRLVAYLTPAGEVAPAASELRSFLAERLPGPILPSAFVALSALPLTDNGKVDRRALPAPDLAPSELRPYEPPRTPAETLLAGIWRRLLPVERVGRHDSFLASGGDSILSIQLLARAREAGIELTPRQVLADFTLAELAHLAELAGPAPTFPLTPAGRWFFDCAFPEPYHWNLSLLLAVERPLSREALRRALAHLWTRHEALRLRFVGEENGREWRQHVAPVDSSEPLLWIDLSSLPERARQDTLGEAAACLQASLDLARGPLVRFAWFEPGVLGDPGRGRRPGRLLLVCHHLTVDLLSLQILYQDLETAYEQAVRGEELRSEPPAGSFLAWAERLSEHAQSAALHAELGYWLAPPRSRPSRLPVDFPAGDKLEASAERVVVDLSAGETRQLLTELPRRYRMQGSEVVLTALALALSSWTGEPVLRIDVEGHGREPLFPDLDPARIVGWLTAVYPLMLDLEGALEPAEALERVKAQLRAVPNGGIGYGLLRYGSRRPGVAERLAALPAAEISFNYQARSLGHGSSWLLPTDDPQGPLRSPRGRRGHLLEVSGGVREGRLHLTWRYSTARHRRATVATLAETCVKVLRQILSHATGDKARDLSLLGVGAGEHTGSFPSRFSGERREP